jgi:hypothetical protein
MVTLTFGDRRVSVPGNPGLLVDDLLQTAGELTRLDPSSLLLINGELTLHRGTYLGDYPSLIGSMGMSLSVTSAGFGFRNADLPGPPGSRPPNAPGKPPVYPVLPLRTSDSTFTIFIIFEGLPTMEPVVWASMQIRRLCHLVAGWAGVPSDTVYLQFAGSVLDLDRQLSDAPAIRSGAHVYAFFTIARALQFVLHLLQGGTPPPPSTPPTNLPIFGPVLPPGHARNPTLSPHTSPYPAPPANHQLSMRTPGSGSRPTASERLRSTFKCPKFLGETRHWKVWNQGFVRFLSINHLDHVVEEDFLKAALTLEQQDDNKLVYYILEDSVSGSPTASKYVHRAAMWNGHEAYYLLYSGFALSGPANAAILLAELSNFRFKVDETPSEVVLRLQELFDDLESLPGTAAMVMNDTQKINYLLSAVRPERSLALVYSQIQTAQVRWNITFVQACEDLQFRDEAIRADDLLHAAHLPTKIRGLVAPTVPPANLSDTVVLITTTDERQNKVASKKTELTPCMVKGCDVMSPPACVFARPAITSALPGKHLPCGSKLTTRRRSILRLNGLCTRLRPPRQCLVR